MLVEHFARTSFAVAAIFAAAGGTPSTTSDWIQMVERLGLAVTLVIFFVVTGWIREKRMAARLDKLEEMNSILERENSALSTKVASLAEQVAAVLRRDGDVLDEALQVLDNRTCFAFKNRDEFDAFREALKEWRANKRANFVEEG